MTAAIALPDFDAAKTVADQALATAQSLATQLLAVQATTAEQAQWAVEVAHQVRDQQKAFEAERDTVAKPLRKLASTHSRRWKAPIDLLGQVIQHLKSTAVAFQIAEQQRQAAALQAATSPTEVASAVAVLAPKPAGLSTRETWGWEIEDQSKIPLEYYVLDTARLDREARERKGDLAVPGIKPVRHVSGVLR